MIMPELPEVENVVQKLRPFLVGRSLRRVQVLNPAIIKAGRKRFEKGLRGQRIEQADRRGKYILISLSSGHKLVFHLGMTGRLILAEPRRPIEKHTHLIFHFEGVSRQLRHSDARRFGGAYRMSGQENALQRRLSRLGPDPLTLDSPAFPALFRNRRARMKPLLLNQDFLSGLGNIYADEALHDAGIHPRQIAASIGDGRLRRLHQGLVRILRHAIAEGGSTINDYLDPDGLRGGYQAFYHVYARQGEPCLRQGCSGTIRRVVVGGRSTHFCPMCQRQRSDRRESASPREFHLR